MRTLSEEEAVQVAGGGILGQIDEIYQYAKEAATEFSASASASSTRAPLRWKIRPSSVSRIALPMRSYRRAPSRASSRATSLLTAEGDRPSRRAAAEKLPSSTTHRKTVSSPNLSKPLPGDDDSQPLFLRTPCRCLARAPRIGRLNEREERT